MCLCCRRFVADIRRQASRRQNVVDWLSAADAGLRPLRPDRRCESAHRG